MITANGFSWRHAGRRQWALHDLTFTIEPGERVLLLGPSGAGKSTLLHHLAGVVSGDEGDQQGTLLVDGRHPTRTIGVAGLVQQDPEASVVLARVGDDVAFGCENLAVPRDQIWPRVRQALDEVGLDVPLHHPTRALSGGQKQRLALAGALAMQAQLLLLDEPTANLDPAGVNEVVAAVARATADQRRTLVVVEHRVDIWLDHVDRVLVLDADGGIIADGPARATITSHADHLREVGIWVPDDPLPLTPLPPRGGAPIISGHALGVGRSAEHPVQTGLDVAIAEGCSTVLAGPNGVGKTTLALTLAGLLPPLAGEVRAADPLVPPAAPRSWWRRSSAPSADPATWRSRDLTTRIGTVFQHPEHQFVATTVRAELEAGPRALGWDEARLATRTDELLQRLRLHHLAEMNPFTLSGGEKRRLSVATVLATGPAVLFLDEPTFGQDRSTWLELVRLVQELVDDGATVVSVTHDRAYVEVLGQHILRLGPDGVSVGGLAA